MVGDAGGRILFLYLRSMNNKLDTQRISEDKKLLKDFEPDCTCTSIQKGSCFRPS